MDGLVSFSPDHFRSTFLMVVSHHQIFHKPPSHSCFTCFFAYLPYDCPSQIKTSEICPLYLPSPWLTYRSESKKRFWYKQKAGKPGKQLPPKYKQMFVNKQIVCIKYMEISEGDKQEIFRVRCDPYSTLSQGSHLFITPQHVQLGMALNYAKRMKAEALIPRQSPRPSACCLHCNQLSTSREFTIKACLL